MPSSKEKAGKMFFSTTYVFHARWEPGTTTTTKTRGLDFRNKLQNENISAYMSPSSNAPILPSTPKSIKGFILITPRARGLYSAYPIMALQNNILGPVPIAIFHRRLQIRPMVPVEVCEYPILVLQTAMTMYRGSVLLDGREGTQSVPLGSDGAGGKIGEGGRRRGSRRSRYHDGERRG